jgi:hypothetical protein
MELYGLESGLVYPGGWRILTCGTWDRLLQRAIPEDEGGWDMATILGSAKVERDQPGPTGSKGA